ncbi:MAG TPA: hypothetical protein VIY47_16610, partial [Ignavibacteriaceae bacterium]
CRGHGMGRSLVRYLEDIVKSNKYECLVSRSRADADSILKIFNAMDFEKSLPFMAEMGGTKFQRHFHVKKLKKCIKKAA